MTLQDGTIPFVAIWFVSTVNLRKKAVCTFWYTSTTLIFFKVIMTRFHAGPPTFSESATPAATIPVATKENRLFDNGYNPTVITG